MQDYIQDVNDLLSLPLLLIYITNLTYFCQIPNKLINVNQEGYIVENIHMLLCFIYSVSIWKMCSQIHYEVWNCN